MTTSPRSDDPRLATERLPIAYQLADETLPVHDDELSDAFATALPVYRDQLGYVWLQVGEDGYAALTGQLLRAIRQKWRLSTREQADASGGGLIELRRGEVTS
jgi:hypothetical protein